MNDTPLWEQKLVYRLLHKQLTQAPELMDGQFLHDLQTRLQKVAVVEGIDPTDHGQWDAWLGNEVIPCDIRMSQRRTL